MLRHSDSTTRSPGPAPLVTSLLLGPTDHPTQSKQGKSRKRTAVPTPTLQRSDDNGPNLTLIPQMDTVADPTDLPFTATAPPVDSDSELRLHQPHYQTASVTQRSLLDNFAIPGQSSVPSHGLHNPLNVSSDNPQDIPHSLPTHSANVLPDIDDERSGEDNRNAQSTIYDRLDDQRRELDNTWGQDRAIPVSGIDTHSECESNRSRMESQFADRLFHLEQDFSDEIQTSRQQVEKKITYFRIGRLPDREGHDFGAIYKAMPDARRRFTVKLVQKYAWLKEEMTESVARNVAQYCLSARHLEYLQLNCQTRPQYVGHFLKMVLRSGKQQIENEFLNALQTEGRDGIRFTNEVEQLLVTREKMKAFEDLQTERNQYHISEERLPNVCFHSVEVDILNDHLFSRLFFSYKEHSDIEEYNRSSMFFETFRKCQENVFDAFKCICDTNGIFINGNAQRDNSRITDVIIDEPSTPPSLQTIGIETIHTNEGSLVMILKLTEEHSLTNLKDKCEDGSIGDVLIDLLQRKDVRERLNAGTYDFKMKLHATTEDAHFVEMKIEGTIFDQKERMCIHPTGEDSKNLSQVHPRRICEELEMSDHLLDILQKGKLVPPDITSKLQVKVNRRDKIHELLRHYDIRKDNGFGTLSSYIKTVRETRGKKAYPLKLFEGNFVAKFDGSSFRLVHTGLCVTWSSSSVAGKSEKHNTSSDSPNSPCTQLFDSTQTTNMDDPSMTKVTEQDKAQKVMVKDLLEKLKAKKQLKEERRDDDYTSLNPNPGPSTETNIYNRHETKAQRDLANVEKHVNRCRTMISDVKGLFDGHPALSLPREQAWRQELADVEKGLTFPKTVIAVVGNTGEGKSSLMNAVLDHGNVLPTSGLRACTAVVVEVDQNTTSNSFEADIELLQSKEWFDELQILLKELQDDTNKKNDASASYCKVKAVYGRIGSFEILSEITDVTNMLGSIIHIQENDPEEFRLQIEKYIANQDSGTGGQYWPIVKHVRLRMPHCDVCSSGTTLVDLPGVRDSNAARDKIAKNYLKNCTAVWVVSSIHRAIDDKTAKDLLGENFRRQLLMDGQYGSIAFICTKTDVITPSEIIRSLNLNEKTKEYEENVKNMENMKTAVVKEIANVNNVLGGLRKSIEDQKNEARELKDTLANIDSLLEPAEGEQVQNEELEIIQEYKEELKTKDALIRENEDREHELLQQQKEACEKKTSLEKKISQERNKIVAICALARNDYSSSHIKRDFKDGLREMKRQNGMLNTEDPEEEEDLYVDDSDDDDGSTTNNLRVFCCSSTEYQKMKNLPAYDGPPQVFSNLTDTQIPALRNYVHEMTYNRQRQSLERLIHNLGRLVFDMHIYASERLNTIVRGVQAAGSAIEDELERLDTDLGNALQKLTADIDDIFDGSLRPKIEKGASSAYEEANNTCAKWGAPAIRDRTTDRREGGLSCKTYIATTRRNGVYYSPTFGPVDFNEDLAAPMYRSMAIVWDTAFSEMLWRLMDQLHADIVARILDFNDRLQKQLELLGISAMRTDRLATQAICSANNKLTEMVSNLKDVVTPWQREISRIVTPHIQTMMLDEYGQCAADSGKDVFVRMKTYMAQGIDSKRGSMFDEAKQMLMEQLMKLRTELVQDVKSVKDILITDLRRGFEPLWEAPSKSLVARQAFAKVLDEFTVKMRVIYQEAGIQNTEDGHKLPAPRRGHSGGAAQGSSSVTTVARVQGDSTVARQPEWPTYTATIHKMEDTSYDTASTEAPLMAIGQQTLNDVYQDTLEDSPAAVSLLPKLEPDETATFSEPPAKKSKQENNQRTNNQASHIAGLQTPSQQVSSPSSTRTIQSTNMNCSQPARIGEKGKGPGKSKGNMNSPLLSQTTTPKQTIPTSTVVTEPQDRSIQTTPTVTVTAEPTNMGYKEQWKLYISQMRNKKKQQ